MVEVMQTTFDHILVPVDFTAKNDAAIEIAKRLALQDKSRVSLLHVIESLDFSDDEEIKQFLDKMEKRSSEQLQLLLERFQDCDLEVTVETAINNRSRGVVLYAMENEVDLIVMNSHRIDPNVKHDHWATISYQVSLVCPCSIMLVKSPSPSGERGDQA